MSKPTRSTSVKTGAEVALGIRPPPAPLVVRPGRYRTRGGRVATVVGPSDMTTWPWIGRVEGERQKMSWTNDGRQSSDPNIESSIDLVAEIPDAKKPKPQPAPGKGGKVRADPTGYGVWVACSSRASAQGIADSLDANGYRCLTVMKLPIGRGRKS